VCAYVLGSEKKELLQERSLQSYRRYAKLPGEGARRGDHHVTRVCKREEQDTWGRRASEVTPEKGKERRIATKLAEEAQITK